MLDGKLQGTGQYRTSGDEHPTSDELITAQEAIGRAMGIVHTTQLETKPFNAIFRGTPCSTTQPCILLKCHNSEIIHNARVDYKSRQHAQENLTTQHVPSTTARPPIPDSHRLGPSAYASVLYEHQYSLPTSYDSGVSTAKKELRVSFRGWVTAASGRSRGISH